MDYFNVFSPPSPANSTLFGANVSQGDTDSLPEIITKKVEKIVFLEFYSYKSEYFLAIISIICLGGFVGNVLIICTFLKMGLKDSVTIALFNIAIADLNYINTMLAVCVCQFCEYVPRDVFFMYKLHPYSVEMTCKDFILEVFSTVSTYGTTFVAIQRCLCVLRPIQFNGMFTRCRTTITMAVIWILNVGLSLVGLRYRGVVEERWSNGNTWLTLVYISRSKWNNYISIHGIVFGVVDWFCQCAILLGIFIMIRELHRSVQFRKLTSNVGSIKVEGGHGKKQGSINDAEKSQAKNKVENVGAKEKRVTIQVTLVAALFILTNFHRLLFEVVKLNPTVWEFIEHNWYILKLYFSISRVLYLVNASANFLIFYKYNTRFREMCFKR